jgi:hypothetical protein
MAGERSRLQRLWVFAKQSQLAPSLYGQLRNERAAREAAWASSGLFAHRPGHSCGISVIHHDAIRIAFRREWPLRCRTLLRQRDVSR